MKARIAFSIVSLLLISAMAHSDVGVAVGHNTWADDGLPNIGKGEQVSIFTCVGQEGGSKAMDCAVDKCRKAFKIPAGAPVKKVGPTTLVGGKCAGDGWSERKGHSIVMVGPRGDNVFIMSKALGDPTREAAWEFVKSNNFPVDKGTIVFDYYDDPDMLRAKGKMATR